MGKAVEHGIAYCDCSATRVEFASWSHTSAVEPCTVLRNSIERKEEYEEELAKKFVFIPTGTWRNYIPVQFESLLMFVSWKLNPNRPSFSAYKL